MNYFKEKVRTTVGMGFQFIFILLNLLLLLVLVFWKSTTFISYEEQPKLHSITPEVFKSLGGFSHTVTVGLIIDDFFDFNMVSNTFSLEGTVWFKYKPGAISVESLSQFSFAQATIDKKGNPDIRLVEDQMLVQFPIRITFKSDLNYQDFPLESHSIYIVLQNRAIEANEVIFTSSRREFSVLANERSTGWELVDTSVETGYIDAQLDPYDTSQDTKHPAAVFALDYTRNSVRYALSIILPLALIFYLMLLSISLRLLTAIAITAAGITAILAYRFVIENLSPKTGFFMISDYLFFLFLAGTIGIFLINVAEEMQSFSPRIKKIFVTFLQILTALGTIYIIVW